MAGPLIRPATEADLPAILDIYNEQVLNSTATFDVEPRSLAAQREWVKQFAPPYVLLVAEEAGEVVAWGCLHPYHTRPAYRFTTEDSVYVHQDHRGRGVGRLILARLVETGRDNGFHSIMAGMSEGNEASVRLHASFGFTEVGIEREVGYKFECWLDVTWMQLML